MNCDTFIRHLVNLTQRNGGVTMDLAGRVAEDGYAVGGYATSLVLDKEVPAEEWAAMIHEWIQRSPLLTIPGYHLGTWLDTSDGRLYVDVVRVYHDCEKAKAEAISFGELAFYDLTHGREIRLDTVPA